MAIMHTKTKDIIFVINSTLLHQVQNLPTGNP